MREEENGMASVPDIGERVASCLPGWHDLPGICLALQQLGKIELRREVLESSGLLDTQWFSPAEQYQICLARFAMAKCAAYESLGGQPPPRVKATAARWLEELGFAKSSSVPNY